MVSEGRVAVARTFVPTFFVLHRSDITNSVLNANYDLFRDTLIVPGVFRTTRTYHRAIGARDSPR